MTTVFIIESGDYENRYVVAVHATLEGAMKANPIPGEPGGIPLRAVPGEHTDPTQHRYREGGWERSDDEQKEPMREWNNGFDSDFGVRIIEMELLP